MDESEAKILFWVVALFAMGVFSYFMLRSMKKRQREYEQERAEREQFLENFAHTLTSYEIEKYKKLPNQDARITWLEKNHSEFIEKMPYSIVTFKTAKHLDIKLLDNTAQWEEVELLQRYLERAENVSLNLYQEDLNSFASWIKTNTERGFNREAKGSKLWESLPSSTRSQIERERNPAERKKLLASGTSESTSTYEMDYLYPVILMSYLDSNTSDSGGDVSYYDGSSDFGGGDSGGDSGGGDGGGGGGD